MIFSVTKKALFTYSLLFLTVIFSPLTFAEPNEQTAATIPSPSVSNVQNHGKLRAAPEALPHFKGVGNANGKVDTGFIREEKPHKSLEDEGRQNEISLPAGLQKFVDSAGRTIRNIDEATLKAVNAPLDLLGIEAESARIRPSHGGVGLGVSIKLDREKKQAKDKGTSTSVHGEKNEVYELLAPQNDSQNHSPSGF